jgi:2-phosphosulfolactate phosphatase
MNNIQTILYNRQIDNGFLHGKTSLIIDVFRATSVIVTALANSAEEVVVCSSKEEAIEEYNSRKGVECLLAGENGMHKIDGFTHGNSPQQFVGLPGKRSVILVTTNGTQAIHYARNSEELYIASLLNSHSVSEKILSEERDICFVCSGSKGKFALEDAFCAGKIISYLKNKKEDYSCDDLSICLISLYEANKNNSSGLLRGSEAFLKLSANGYKEDAEFCMQENIYNITPKLSKLSKNSVTI